MNQQFPTFHHVPVIWLAGQPFNFPPTYCLISYVIVDCSTNIGIIALFFGRYLIASHTTDYQHSMLFLNTLAVTVLFVAKLPNMHKVRIFGINAGS